jgi:hypothetical protein
MHLLSNRARILYVPTSQMTQPPRYQIQPYHKSLHYYHTVHPTLIEVEDQLHSHSCLLIKITHLRLGTSDLVDVPSCEGTALHTERGANDNIRHKITSSPVHFLSSTL